MRQNHALHQDHAQTDVDQTDQGNHKALDQDQRPQGGDYKGRGSVAARMNSPGNSANRAGAGPPHAGGTSEELQQDGGTTQQLLELLGSDSEDSVVSADSFGEPHDPSVGIMQRRVTAVRPGRPHACDTCNSCDGSGLRISLGFTRPTVHDN